ncbi:Crp/Fnr family transcriptional regulator [Sphingomonas sp. M6A6_1c]
MTDENKTDPRYVNRMVSARAQGGVPVRPDRVLDITVPPRPSPPVFDSRLLDSPFLSRVERQALRDAMGSPTLVSAYTDLVREDGRAGDLILIAHGWGGRYATTRQGGRQFLALLVPGDVANLDTLLFDRLDYGVLTLTEASIVRLRRGDVAALAAQHAGIARSFTWLAIQDNATLGQWTLSLGRRSARARLAHLLCELSTRLAAEHQGRSRFRLPLTQEHLADVLGLTSVHVNRMMRELRDQGLIEAGDRVITIPNVAKLHREGDFDPGYLHAGSVPVLHLV